jgi:thioredoxin-related protein
MLKKIIFVLLIVTSSLMAADLHWAKNYTTGMAEAMKENKPVLLIVSSTACKYCLLLDKNTLHDKRVIKALNSDFIAIRSWVDKGDYIPTVVAQNTPGLPGIWFLYPDGTPMYKPLLGYIQSDSFVRALGLVKDEFEKNKKRVK